MPKKKASKNQALQAKRPQEQPGSASEKVRIDAEEKVSNTRPRKRKAGRTTGLRKRKGQDRCRRKGIKHLAPQAKAGRTTGPRKQKAQIDAEEKASKNQAPQAKGRKNNRAPQAKRPGSMPKDTGAKNEQTSKNQMH